MHTPLKLLLPYRLLVSAVVFWIASAGCDRQQPPPPGATQPHRGSAQASSDTVVQVGAVLPLTGAAAEFGVSFRNALALAVDDANSRRAKPTDVRFQLHVEDGQSDAKNSIAALERLITTKHPTVVFSCLSSVTLALIPVTERAGILMFADAAHPDITRRGTLVLRHSNVATEEAAAIAAKIRESSRRTMVVVAVNDDYGKAVADALQSQPIGTFEAEPSVCYYDRSSVDVTPVINASLATRPAWIVVAGYGNIPGLVVRRLRERGFDGEIITSLPFLLSQDGITAAGDAVRGLLCVTYELQRTPELNDLTRRYTAQFGNPPGLTVFQDYASFQLFAHAVQSVGSAPEAIKKAVVAMKSFEGVSGRLKISELGDIASPVTVRAFSEALLSPGG